MVQHEMTKITNFVVKKNFCIVDNIESNSSFKPRTLNCSIFSYQAGKSTIFEWVLKYGFNYLIRPNQHFWVTPPQMTKTFWTVSRRSWKEKISFQHFRGKIEVIELLTWGDYNFLSDKLSIVLRNVLTNVFATSAASTGYVWTFINLKKSHDNTDAELRFFNVKISPHIMLK